MITLCRNMRIPSTTRTSSLTLLVALLLMLSICQTAGFASVADSRRGNLHLPKGPLTSLQASRKNGQQFPSRLSNDEQAELLEQAVQARILRNARNKLALQKPTLQVSPLEISRALGCSIDEQNEIENRGYAAREKLVTTNMGLVYHAVNEIVGKTKRKLKSLSKEDLVQEGAIGLARAVDRWDPSIGGKFSTYGMYWVRAAVFRCIAERDDLVRVPEHVSTAIRRVSRAAQALGIELDGESLTMSGKTTAWQEAYAAKELAEAAGISDKQLKEVLKVRKRRKAGVVSFETWMQGGKDLDSDVARLASSSDAESETLNSMEKEEIKHQLARFLRPREIEALSWRYGLNEEVAGGGNRRNYLAEAEQELFGGNDAATMKQSIPKRGRWGEAMSFVEVGKRMEVSAEYCRRLCHRAIDKLRQAVDEGALEPAFLT